MQVLIIDNDIAYRNGVSMAASNKHWIPVSCGDIRTAKQIISSTLPDLIISDCLLYGETVIDLLVWMKLQRIDIPVIAVSAAADEALSAAVIKNGADCFYDKLNFATVYKGNIIKNLIMDCQSYTKYRPNETTGGIFVSWRRKEELPTGA